MSEEEPISLSKKKSKDEIENEKFQKESMEMREEMLQAYAKVCFFLYLPPFVRKKNVEKKNVVRRAAFGRDQREGSEKVCTDCEGITGSIY